MSKFVIYDSYFGNTKKIAEVVAKELGEDTKLISILDLNLDELKSAKLIVLGSPIRGWRPSENVQKFFDNLEDDQLKGVKATSFDTRVRKFFHGDATKNMARNLTNFGAEIIVPPTSFDVKGTEGPLFEGEIEKATTWAREINSKLNS